jgi:class 3 adenylate cyclase/tetratricopeptide (TPR) repeat protein
MKKTWSPTGQESLTDVPAAERRQVTVLFADLAGFTQMSREVDPEEMVDILGAYFEVVDAAVLRNGGRLDKHIGDAVMGVFGAPHAYGDEIERALRTSVAIHAGLENASRELGRRVVAHVGIATGEVVAGIVGSRHLSRYTVLGDAANLASRLDSLAKATETLVSDPIRVAIGEGAAWESRGEVRIKGFDRLLPVWRLLELREHQTRVLHGRSKELERMRAALQRTGRLHLYGEPGVGKTALLRALIAEHASDGHPALFIVVPARVITEADRLETQLARALRRAVFGDSHQLEATFLAERPDTFRVGFFDLLLDAPSSDLVGLMRATSAEQRLARRQEALLALLEAWSDGVSVIGLDDVHHLDATGRYALERVVARASDLPIRWATATREPEADASSLPVAGLADDAAALLLPGVPPERIESIVARAGGNPFFLLQLAEAPVGEVPGTIQSLVLSRLDALTAHDKRALQVAASLGSRFPAALLTHVLGSSPARLVESGLLHVDGDDLVFDQELIREGAYASALKAERRAFHRRAAAWFGTSQPERRAEQLELAADREAADSWLVAAEIRRGDGRFAHALSLVDRALLVSPDHIPLLVCRAEILVDLQRADDAMPLIASLLQGELTPLQRARLRVREAEVLRLKTQTSATIENADQVLADVRAAGSPKLVARMLARLGGAYFTAGQHTQMQGVMDEALEHAREAGDMETELQVLSGMGDLAWLTGHYSTAYASFERVVRIARERDLPKVESSNLIVLTGLRFFRAEHHQAMEDAERCVRLARSVGNHRAEVIAACELSSRHGHIGRFAEAERCATEAQRIAASSPIASWVPLIGGYYTPVLFWEGRRQECASLATGTSDWLLGPLRSVFGAVVLSARAACPEDPAEREEFTAQTLALIAAGSLAMSRYHAYAMLIEAAVEREDWAIAQALAERFSSDFTEEPNPVCTAVATRARLLADPASPVLALKAARGQLARLQLEPMLAGIDRRVDSLERRA